MSELFAAMAKAFPAIEGAMKDSDNPAFKRDGKNLTYADLSSVVRAIKPALIANDLFFTQHTHEQAGGVCIETIVHHASGDSLSFGKLFVPAGKQDAHGYGSALTYARRYSLMAAFAVCPEDDDGNSTVAAGPDRITPGQEMELRDLCRDVGADEAAFLKFGGVEKFSDILARDYASAKQALEKRRKPKHDAIIADEIPY